METTTANGTADEFWLFGYGFVALAPFDYMPYPPPPFHLFISEAGGFQIPLALVVLSRDHGLLSGLVAGGLSSAVDLDPACRRRHVS